MCKKAKAGFSLLELTLVICIIALLASVGAYHFNRHIDDSREHVLRQQAQAFARSMQHYRALALANKSATIKMSGEPVHTNIRGWPIGAGAGFEKKTQLSSAACASLWQGVVVEVSEKKTDAQGPASAVFKSSQPERFICRYSLSRNTRELGYFDYDVRTGNVQIVFID